MKLSPIAAALLCAASLLSSTFAAAPVVSNVRASQRAGTKLVDIYYDVADADGDTLTVEIQVSDDNGATYAVPAFTFTGAIGGGVTPGSNRYVVWNAGFDWDGQYSAQTRVRVTAHDGLAPPPNMAYIPQGTFSMGLSGANNAPVHNVFTSAYFADRFEVTSALYNNVRTWAVANGYSLSSGMAAGASHPIVNVNWYDAIKWCNARSEKDGLTPVYYNSAAQTTVYRTGNVDVQNTFVKWTANGYRLPTEAEWEKMARGGLVQQSYPWGNSITNGDANTSGSGDPFEAGNPPTTPVGYYNGSQTPTGPNRANGYGLFDVAGNVREWCWDWYWSGYYNDPTAGTNPQGPLENSGYGRVARGGGWGHSTSGVRCGARDWNGPSGSSIDWGFRCVRGL